MSDLYVCCNLCGYAGNDVSHECRPATRAVTDEMIERGARAYYEADKEIHEPGWHEALSMARAEYRAAARFVLTAALSTNDRPKTEGT